MNNGYKSVLADEIFSFLRLREVSHSQSSNAHDKGVFKDLDDFQYYRLPDLLNELYFKRQTDRYLRMRQALQRRNLLILDDWGMATLDVLAGHEIAQIVEDRLGNRSTIVISQFPVNTWDRIFEDKTTADAVMDRLVHVAYTIELQGPSLRARAASRELQEYKEAMLE
jgi:DNA replication protein DnaC